nr:hypothetical protein [uncultured Acetobacter sp.]
MSQTTQTPAPQRISDLKVSGHLMTLQTGLFCVFHAPGQQPPTGAGLPGVRISQPPVRDAGNISIVTFEEDGWLGGQNGAALIRVQNGPAQILVTVYQELGSPHDAPRLQVVQLSHNANAGPVAQHAQGVPAAQVQAPAAVPVQTAPVPAGARSHAAEIAAHIQRRGDVVSRVGEWMGEPGSHAWIEGFGVATSDLISADEIEYQAVLGKGWLSPWVEGGKYCGSRGMALPILGLCIRLKGKAAQKFICRVTATFTDGTQVGPVDSGEPIEATSLAPLEAFLLEILPREEAGSPKGRRGGKGRGRNAEAEAEAAADLAALLEDELEELEGLGDLQAAEEFDLFVEEEPQVEEAPRKRRPGRPAKVIPAAPEPVKQVARGRKTAVVAPKAASAKGRPATRTGGRGRKAPSRR